jgi:hypothetical protein
MPLTENEAGDEKPASGNSWPVSDQAVVKWVSDRKKKAEQKLGDWYEEAKTDFKFDEGDQWDEADKLKLAEEKRLAVTFNRVQAIVNSVCGQEVTNRQEPRFLARRAGEAIADPMNDAVKWFRDGCNAEDEDSDAFRDMVVCGMGWTCTRMDYEDNPDGEPDVERRDPLTMRWDPAARRKNLADKAWVQADYTMTKDEIEARWPDADLTALVSLSPGLSNAPHDATNAWKYAKNATGADDDGRWTVVHHVERFSKPIHRALDPADGQIKEFSPKDFKVIKERTKALGMELQAVKTTKRVYWEAWTVGAVNLEAGEAKVQKDFQYQAMTCYRQRESGFWFGLVRMMRDPQRYANRMASLMMSILATGAKGGLIYETGAFVNPQKLKADWARYDSIVEAAEGAIAGSKFMPKPQSQMPPGASDMLQLAISSIRDVPGVNVEMLGMRGGDQPGIVEDMRTKAGLTILAPVFDAKRLYTKRQAVLLAEFVRSYVSDGRLIRILGQNGHQFIPLIRDELASEYDIVMDESPASRDVKERTWVVMEKLLPEMMGMGMKPPIEVLDYAPIPESLALAFKKSMMQAQQQPQQPPPEVQIEQMRGQVKKEVAQVQAQVQQAGEQARVQADIQIAQAEARIKAATEQARDASQMELEKLKASMKQQEQIITALIAAVSKVAAAEVTASKDTDMEARQFTNAQAYPQ